MAFKTYENLSKSGQQAYKDFMWGDGSLKIAYDEVTGKMLVHGGNRGSRKGNRTRYFILIGSGVHTSFLANDHAEARILASKRDPRAYTIHPNIDNLNAPEYKIHITYIGFQSWYYDYNGDGPVSECENTTFDKVIIYVDDSERESQDKEVRATAKKAFAQLRKAIKAFKYSPKYKHLYRHYEDDDTSCGMWKLKVKALRHFQDWFIIDGDLEELLQQAEAKARAEWIERVSKKEANKREHTRIYVAPPVYQALNVLGLSWPVTKDNLKKKYRALAMQHHPDHGGDEYKFKAINNANEVLLKALN